MSPEGRISNAPDSWISLLCPPPTEPWARVADKQPRQHTPGNEMLEKRAALYLAKCPPAVQGSGGHDSLLFAARALVVGFELSDDSANSLLWAHYNPRCQPPWDESSERDRRDFERKVSEARRTPGKKPSGWLLDETGARNSLEEIRKIARGEEWASNLLNAKVKVALENPAIMPEERQHLPIDEVPNRPFPVEHFPEPVAEYIYQVTRSHQVDSSYVAMPALAVAGAAMGNAWRLDVKKGFVEPPILWVVIVGASGSNKSGPLREVRAPLYGRVPMSMVEGLNNPQGEVLVGNATIEAVVARLDENKRGLMVFNDEIGAWAASFDSYKKGGGDEQAWLEFHGGHPYSVDRKTNSERTRIHAASVCVLGGIQPGTLKRCFTEAQFASGLMPRILMVCPARRRMPWTDAVVSDEATATWAKTIYWLRSRPFLARDNEGHFVPHVCQFSDEAKEVYRRYHNVIDKKAYDTQDQNHQTFLIKSRTTAGRMALIHHGLRLAVEDNGIRLEVSRASMEAGVAWATWCLQEQLMLYGYGVREALLERANKLADRLRARAPDLRNVKARDVMQMNNKKYRSADMARVAMAELVEAEIAEWTDTTKKALAFQ